MRVDWAIPCRYVEINDGLATIIGAGIDTFTVLELPVDLQVLLAVRLVGPSVDFQPDRQHELVGRVLDTQMNEISQLTSTFNALPNPTHLAGWEQATIFGVVHQFRADTAGAYTIDLAVDGQGHTVPLIVRVPGG